MRKFGCIECNESCTWVAFDKPPPGQTPPPARVPNAIVTL